MTTKTRLNTIARRLDELAPREPVVIRMVWHDDATGEEEVFAEWTVDGRAPAQVIQLRWPEDEDDEKRTRQDDAGRA